MSDVPFLPKAIVPGVQYMGDYIGISALEGVVWSCWNDDRTGIHQAYASRMVFPPTSVTVLPSTIPNAFALHQNYPNPFNPSTKIRFVVPVFGFVSLKVYDLLGREVATLVKEEKRAGSYEVQWNAIGFSSGIYFYKLQSGNFVEIKRMVMIK
ncbi:MAG: T9SS type A sorting domain-containing protein [Ignavibacteriales bacterium]|nr:T9SS type A sorting domain-containing protein [Ignavibacteriales bacterium]